MLDEKIEVLRKTAMRHAEMVLNYLSMNDETDWFRKCVFEYRSSISVNLIPDLPNSGVLESLELFGFQTASRWHIPKSIVVLSETANDEYLSIYVADAAGTALLVNIPIFKNELGFVKYKGTPFALQEKIDDPKKHAALAMYRGIIRRRNRWLIKW